MNTESKLIDKVAWLHFEDGRVLSTLSKGKDTWYFPGGKRDEVEKGGLLVAETDEEVLLREISEELGVRILSDTIEPYGTFEAHAHGEAASIIVRMSCYTADFVGELTPQSEIERIRFITSENSPETSEVDQLIIADLVSKGLID